MINEALGPTNLSPHRQIEIGILTSGKPTLAMTLANLLMQDPADLRIVIVDTSDKPVIERQDVLFALKLAQDRKIRCDYQRSRDKQRNFSVGRLALIEQLTGPHVCFMDDDVVLPSASLARMAEQAFALERYGYIAPTCVNAGASHGFLAGRPHYSPGGIFYQDETIRQILLEYYRTTVDVLDTQRTAQKVWELAFLAELFPALGRACHVQADNVSYHLDYHRGVRVDLMEQKLLYASQRKVEELVERFAGQRVALSDPSPVLPH
jgi:glycosyl transferase family 2